jgi:hypothetical protein
MPRTYVPFLSQLKGMTDEDLLRAWRDADLARDEQRFILVEAVAATRWNPDFQQRYAQSYPHQTRYQRPREA